MSLIDEWRQRLESVQTGDQSLETVRDAYQLLRDAREIADMAAWFHSEFRGYPLAPGAEAAGVARTTFYRDVARHEERR